MLGYIEAGENLDAGGNGFLEVLGKMEAIPQNAVHPESNTELLFLGIQMNIGGTFHDGLGENHVGHLDDGRFLGQSLQILSRLLAFVLFTLGFDDLQNVLNLFVRK